MEQPTDLPPRYEHTPDGSIIDKSDGRVMFFSIERFTKDIGESDCCFVCGASPSAKTFNDEHVIPDWILRRFQLYNHKIRLPNRAETTYGGYTVSCCTDCNTLMGRTFETPLSALTQLSYWQIRAAAIHPVQRERLFNWLVLIFVKTHLKDKLIPLHRDLRKGREKIASGYTWQNLHHLHCVARSFYTGAAWRPGIVGSFFIFPAVFNGGFDYRDDYETESMLIRVGDVAFVAGLADAGAAANHMDKVLSKARRIGVLSRPQLREILAHVAYYDYRITPRPYFSSGFPDERLTMGTAFPERQFLEEGYASLGEQIWKFSDDVLEDLQLLPSEHDRIAREIMTGQYKLMNPSWAKPQPTKNK